MEEKFTLTEEQIAVERLALNNGNQGSTKLTPNYTTANGEGNDGGLDGADGDGSDGDGTDGDGADGRF